MAQNVEIKAVARDWTHLCDTAARLATKGPSELYQRDLFFDVPSGRLKLRSFGGAAGELIAYHRPDQAGPKLSRYQITPVADAAGLEQTLGEVLPLLGIVAKKRTVYWVDRTRVHLDEVTDLGRFLELEVVLAEGESPAQGRQVADHLLQQLGVAEADLLTHAYLDLLRALP